MSDFRYALRTLLKAPAFTIVVVLTLALGIGANTAIFSLTDQVLLRMLPVKSPEQLVVLDGPGAFRGRTFNNGTLSYPMYRDIRDQNTVFDGVIARFPAPLTLLTNGQSERVSADLVTGNYFDVLGVRAQIGRTFTPDDDRTNIDRVTDGIIDLEWATLQRLQTARDYFLGIERIDPPKARPVFSADVTSEQ